MNDPKEALAGLIAIESQGGYGPRQIACKIIEAGWTPPVSQQASTRVQRRMAALEAARKSLPQASSDYVVKFARWIATGQFEVKP